MGVDEIISQEHNIEHLDQIKVCFTVLESGKVDVKILPHMAVLNEKYPPATNESNGNLGNGDGAMGDSNGTDDTVTCVQGNMDGASSGSGGGESTLRQQLTGSLGNGDGATDDSNGTDDTDTYVQGNMDGAGSSTNTGSGAGTSTPRQKFTFKFNITQFAQKDLSLRTTAEFPYENGTNIKEAWPTNIANSHMRVKFISQFLKGRLHNQPKWGDGMTVCVMQELRGDGGQLAVDKFVEYLNAPEANPSENEYDRLIVRSNPMGRRVEKVAIIWNKNSQILGCGARFTIKYDLSTVFTEMISNNINADLPEGLRHCLKNCTDLWMTVKDQTQSINDGFDRNPVWFTLENCAFLNGEPLHVITVHAATGSENRSAYQNIVETVVVQNICFYIFKKMGENGENVILLGDFNTAEQYNQTERFWDNNVQLNELNAELGNDNFDEVTLFNGIRTNFLTNFTRVVDKAVPTNVYPFLSGGDSIPKHNDDIWIPSKWYEHDFDSGSHTFSGVGESQSGVTGIVHNIPKEVLEEWDKKSLKYFSELGGRAFNRNNLNLMLSKIWSDHRPLTAKIQMRKKRTPERTSTSITAITTVEDEIAGGVPHEDIIVGSLAELSLAR